MRSYLAFSAAAHAAILTGMIASATLLSKPRMSYYAVDLFSGLPAGRPGGTTGGEAANLPPVEQPAEAVEEPSPDAQEIIKVKGKSKTIRAAKHPVVPAAASRKPAALEGAMRSLMGSTPGTGGHAAVGAGSGSGGMGGSGLVAETGGPAFPYPWYLKAITDKLDKHWKPPEEFAADTVCQVTFVIARDGQVSGVALGKVSGDSFFDQLALRAVQNSVPMPPLPAGFPDDTLKVHMKFIGKR